MRLLADRHHSDLFYGLQRLFEDRLSLELYTPIGHDWWTEGYWQFGAVFGDDRLARQYLDLAWREVEPGLHLGFDNLHPERPIYGVTVAAAREMRWDFVSASVQENQAGMARFAAEAGARYLYHVGNARQQVDLSLSPLILNAAEADTPPERTAFVGQEFDWQTTFRYQEPAPSRRITSAMNLLPGVPEAAVPWTELAAALPDWEFRSYGHSCPDGFLAPVQAVADAMARSAWAFHCKPTGDGFGHVIHNWAAIGRPLIGRGSYYGGQRASPLWDDMRTAVDLDRHTIAEAAEIIGGLSVSEHMAMCRAIRGRLEAIYDPAGDAERVAALLGL